MPWKEKLCVAAIQMNSTPDVESNLQQAERWLKAAKKKGADLVAFPETFLLLSEKRSDLLKNAQTSRGSLVRKVSNWAKRESVWILGGSLPFKTSDRRRVSNTSLLFDPKGKIRARYDKIHLFDSIQKDRSYRESSTTRAGRRISRVQTPWGPFGLSVCYDLRFPELYRKLASNLVFIPSAFTIPTGKAHWDSLTRARAIENQSFVICPAQTGTPYPGRKTYGHTRVIDAWGRILAEKKKGPGVVVATLDFKELQEIRKKLPALQHRRL